MTDFKLWGESQLVIDLTCSTPYNFGKRAARGNGATMMSDISVRSVDDWQTVASQAFVPLRCSSAEAKFSASLRSVSLGEGLSFSRVRSGPVKVEHSTALGPPETSDDILISVQVSSLGRVHQNGRTADLAPGSGCLYESRSPYVLDHQAPGQDLLVIQASRRRLGISSSVTEQLSGRVMDSTVPGYSTFTGFALGLTGEVDLPRTSRDSLLNTGAGLARALLMSFASVQTIGQSQPERLLEKIKADIEQRLSDPSLTVEQIAIDHHLSVRSMHSLFAESSSTPGAFIREARLRRAVEALERRSQTGQTVESIGRESGFKDPSTFARAFKRQYGTSPAQWGS